MRSLHPSSELLILFIDARHAQFHEHVSHSIAAPVELAAYMIHCDAHQAQSQ